MCGPANLLYGLRACLSDEDGVVEVARDMRPIPLEQEFFKCETIDWKIDAWAGIENSNPYADRPHPWLAIPDLKPFVQALHDNYESVLSSYFRLTGIEVSRREAWSFWSKSIFRNASNSPQNQDEAQRWEAMQRAYFNSREQREEFLNNLLAAIRNPEPKSGAETQIDEASAPESSSYGFVYFVRNGDLHKIGITENLLRRLGELQPDEVLNVVRCKNFQEVERKLHAEFKAIRLPQTEYFRMQPGDVIEVHRLLLRFAEV
jgi:hypothetical protein